MSWAFLLELRSCPYQMCGTCIRTPYVKDAFSRPATEEIGYPVCNSYSGLARSAGLSDRSPSRSSCSFAGKMHPGISAGFVKLACLVALLMRGGKINCSSD